jgi:acyl-CoA thioesterase FadM
MAARKRSVWRYKLILQHGMALSRAFLRRRMRPIAELITGRRYGFPFVHIECDFKIPSRIGEVIDRLC